jgi:methylenetetrahydrofolate dehydrogenase (NADP+)/methenyltetrahydrofolate cyclohydrolase
MTIIDGKKISEDINQELKIEIDQLKKSNIIPKLIIVQVGNFPASNVYVRNKLRLSDRLGAITELKKYPEDLPSGELISIIQKLNADNSVNGILVQMPLPKHINETDVIAAIDPSKDVDCFHLVNIGKL